VHLAKGTETILVLEDDPRLRKVLSRRLRGLGYQIIEADNGVAAMAVVVAQPDSALIFTDMVTHGSRSPIRLTNSPTRFARF
jgi:CheY-like chemotaxis protein